MRPRRKSRLLRLPIGISMTWRARRTSDDLIHPNEEAVAPDDANCNDWPDAEGEHQEGQDLRSAARLVRLLATWLCRKIGHSLPLLTVPFQTRMWFMSEMSNKFDPSRQGEKPGRGSSTSSRTPTQRVERGEKNHSSASHQGNVLIVRSIAVGSTAASSGSCFVGLI